ncbi:2d3bbba1-f887-4403-9fcb-0dd026ae338b [Thermothielavioides terrestris]|uniref:NYN domain-containing protein n=2 Tax=Thermothielavioides terrestris TaxID=2587410 RepID=G2R6Q6_THETT|nr:uncharacterized protein THITE_2116571 [Thermothielavioides terrestris NRRL 8126]AEO67688.1 hypothetical protein THITE_2116571 [Thermothielavioides terrestris NRRL 8126]SPQ25816.1 2d3bbba1-f887-4403-9fcb-0dd026ae338b [Thermothielavioides terrestris]
MASYFGRLEHDGRRLGADLDLIAKWARAFNLRHPIHSYYLTQLSDDDRAKLFSGPAQEFRLLQGPNDTLKLETVKDEVDRIDPDVQAMMRSNGYLRSEAKRFEILDAIEDAQDEAQAAAALALSKALLSGMDGPPAEKLSKQVADKILDSAAYRVKAQWRAARHERLRNMTSEPANCSGLDGVACQDTPTKETAGSPVGPDFIARWNATLRERFPGLAVNGSLSFEPATDSLEDTRACKSNSDKGTAKIFTSDFTDVVDNQATPHQKPAAEAVSPSGSVPEYGSETSAGSVHWSSPGYSAGDSLSSPDIDSVFGPLDDADGGVALLPSSLADELGLTDESEVATPTPALHHLGAGLEQAYLTVRSGFNAMSADSVSSTFNSVNAPTTSDPFATQGARDNNTAAQDSTLEASPGPFSLTSSKPHKYPLAKEQPWMGFTCYEVASNLGNGQLVPKYWTTKRGKERYLRYKIGDLKLDDAKLRSDRVSGAVARNPVHVFVDLSNIIIGFYDSMKESRGIPVNKRIIAPPFSFKNFDTILTRDRNVAKRIVAGSLSNSHTKRWPGYMLQAQELKYEMNILERVPKPASALRNRKSKAGARDRESATSGADTSGDDFVLGPMKHGEQGVDELLHLKILQSAMDTPNPATVVLATGDAASAQYSDGFKKNIERVLSHGWNLELYAWRRNISSAWREPEFAKKWGHQFKIIELDGFCEELFDMTIESLEH